MSPIADEIFVGSVSVGVVPDLRGFNDRLRASLVPSANAIGREMGQEISRGVMAELDFGSIITKLSAKSMVSIRANAFKMGTEFGKSFRRGVELQLEDPIKAKVELDSTELAIARVELDNLTRDRTVKIRTSTSGAAASAVAQAIIPGGSSRGGGGGGGVLAGGASGGAIGGISSLLKALPGGTSGSIAAVPPQVLVPAAAIAAASLPFVAQAGAGLGVGALGAGLAGMGIAGAFGAGGQTAAQIAPLQGSAQAAAARVVADQARLNQLRSSGKATTAQLAAAEATLAGARNTQATAQTKYQQAERLRITSGQEAVRASFTNLKVDALGSLNTIGAAFVPVMQNIFGTADKTIKSMTPVFAGAEKIIAGPFQTIVDTVLKAFTDPQVKSSIDAVAGAFGDVLKAFTPDIKGIMDSFADAIERMANAISRNPKAFADFLNFIAQFIIMLVDGIAFLTEFADYVEMHFIPAVGHFVNFWKDVWRDVSAAPGIALRFAQGEIERIWHDILGIFSEGAGVGAGALSNVGDAIIAPFMFVYHWVESWFKPWWKANGQALIDIWQSTWFYMSTIVKGLIIGPIVLAVRVFWAIVTEVFRAGSQIVSAVWDVFWGVLANAVRYAASIVTAIVKIFWAQLQAIFRIGAAIIRNVWDGIWQTLELTVRIFWAVTRFIVKTGWDVIVGLFTIFINLITGRWGAAWNAMRNMARQIWNNIKQFLQAVWQALDDFFWQRMNSIRTTAKQVWNAIKQDAIQIWNATWNGIVGATVRGAQNLYNIFTSLKQKILGWFSGTVSWLVNAGKNIVQGLFNGIKSAMGSVGSWIKATVVDPIVNAVKHFFGIKSPASLMVPVGMNVMKGVLAGLLRAGSDLGGMMKIIFGSWPEALGALVGKSLVDLSKLPAKALHALGSVAGKIGGFFSHLFSGGPAGAGVQRWAGTVAQALAMLGQPLSLVGRILYQMQTESGGNPNAINLWDSNAAAGDPSRGLMQVIGGTFAAYHVPGTSTNIYDPLANIAAAINYALHRYGPTLGALGSGHGYAGGTSGAAAGWAWVGERGPEMVLFNGGETVIPNGYATGTDNFSKMVTAGTSLAAALAKVTLSTTSTSFNANQAKFLADLRLYFSPSTARARSQLVISQTNEMKNLQTHIKSLNTSITNATAFQKQELAHLNTYGGITQIGIQGTGAQQGTTLLAGLRSQVGVLNAFGSTLKGLRASGASASLLTQVAGMDPAAGTDYGKKMITALNKMKALHLPSGMIAQLIAAGPDAAIAYSNALSSAGSANLKAIIGAETSLEATRLAVSRGAASVVAGGAYVTGANFVAGLKSQQKNLETQFAHLGKVMGQEAIKWMRVPSNKRPYGYATGGWINEPISGIGQYTGALYTFAEKGREYVVPEGSMGARGGDGAAQYHAHFDGLTGAAIENHVRTAFQAMSMTQGHLQRQGRRS